MKKIIFLLLFLMLIPSPLFAFNEDYVLSDQDLLDYNSMTLQEVRNFLVEKGGFLAYYADFWPESGVYMTSAEIIWNTAQKFKINPKFLLVMLEKEQSLITYSYANQRRLDWAMGYGVCDKCLLSHPLVVQYKGFAKQVYSAADRIINTYLVDLAKHGMTHTGMGPGISKKLDYSYWVTPANNATAILYTYTPHIQGNKNFYTLWNRWFSNIIYPDGSLLQDIASGGIYLIQNGKKRPFLSKGAFISRYSESQIIQVGQSILDKYPNGYPIKFPDYSLLEDENGTLYMTIGDTVRPFESSEVFRSLGFSPFELEEIAETDLAAYEIGQPITQKSAYPTGALLQHRSTGGVYWVYDGTKYPIWHKSILTALFSERPIIQVDDEELEKFEKGDPMMFRDGYLIKSMDNPTVYFISDNKLRAVPSEDVFLAYGWQWENIIWTSDKVLELYELGSPITLDEPITEDVVPETENNNEEILITSI